MHILYIERAVRVFEWIFNLKLTDSSSRCFERSHFSCHWSFILSSLSATRWSRVFFFCCCLHLNFLFYSQTSRRLTRKCTVFPVYMHFTVSYTNKCQNRNRVHKNIYHRQIWINKCIYKWNNEMKRDIFGKQIKFTFNHFVLLFFYTQITFPGLIERIYWNFNSKLQIFHFL